MKKPYLKVFFTAFVIFMLSTVPILIRSGGVYIYFSDYNAQTIPFIQHASDLFHSEGSLPWFDMQTDLGADFISYYCSFIASPLSFLLVLCPPSLVPYMHTVVIGLKMGVGALFAMMWLRQYLKKDTSAFMCALLYVFSGYQLYNMVYQFADIICLFPLTIFCFDKLVTEKRPLGFAFCLALTTLINWYFVWEECVFLLIYFIIRTAKGSFPRLTVKSFIQLAIETSFGIIVTAVLLLPAMITMLGNKRAGNLIFAKDLLAYDEHGVIARIIQSLVLIPEMVSTAWFFNDRDLNFANPALYIPLFSVIGVFAVIKKERKSWYSILLYVCMIIAAIPFLNSIFSLTNAQYYSRWFYMPLLIMIMLTGRYLDDMDSYDPKPAMKFQTILLCIFAAVGMYYMFVQKTYEDRYIDDTQDLTEKLLVSSLGLSAAGLAYMFFLLSPRFKGKISFVNKKTLPRAVCLFCFAMFLVRNISVSEFDNHMQCQNFVENLYNDFVPVDLGHDEFFRVSGNDFEDNCGLLWGYANPKFFNSSTTGEETEFYSRVGIYRTSGITLTSEDYALDSFLSVKYDLHYNKALSGNIPVEPQDFENSVYSKLGYNEPKVINKYIIHTNSNFIPMGFTYDNYINIDDIEPFFLSEEEDNRDWSEVIEESLKSEGSKETGASKSSSSDEAPVNIGSEDNHNKADMTERNGVSHIPAAYDNEKLLLKAIWLTDEQIEKYGDILTELPKEKKEDLSTLAYYQDCADRAKTSCYEFKTTNRGFTAKTNLERDNLVFFSVPYSKGFTAYVDGNETEIEQVFGGLMAVYVPEGDHSIEFRYEMQGFREGGIITIVCLVVLTVYGVIAIILYKKNKKSEKA